MGPTRNRTCRFVGSCCHAKTLAAPVRIGILIYTLTGTDTARAIIQEILDQYLEPINATTVTDFGPPPDLSPWVEDDVPCGLHENENEEYFWHHHAPSKQHDLAPLHVPSEWRRIGDNP